MYILLYMSKEISSLIISGGGSKGAFAGGIVDYLKTVEGKDYDLYVSSSTGTLIQLLSSTGNISRLKIGYTTVKNSDIWKSNPFKIKENKNGKIKIKLNLFKILLNILPKFKLLKKSIFPWFIIKRFSGSTSFGDSSNLHNLIRRFISQKEYNKFREGLNKELVVCVVNATLRRVEYKSSNDWGYDDFCEWTHASCSAYPFMSVVNKNNFQYIDGGILEAVPIQEAINRGATNIDVIILKEESPKFEAEYIRNVMHGVVKEIDMMHTELNKNNIQLGKLSTLNEDVILNIYYTPRNLTNNSLVFDKDIMSGWWDEGFEYAKSKPFKTYKLSKKNGIKLIKKNNIS